MAIDNATLSKESNSKTDVYNIAAKLGFTPNFHTKASKLGHRIVVTISIEQLDVEVTATGLNLMQAEVGAAIEFKRFIKQKFGDEMVNESLQRLSTQNAEAFCAFYAQACKGCTVDLHEAPNSPVIENLNNKDSLRHFAKVSINGRYTGEWIHFISYKKARPAAYLTAAVNIVKHDKAMLDQFQESLQGKISQPPFEPDPPPKPVEFDPPLKPVEPDRPPKSVEPDRLPEPVGSDRLRKPIDPIDLQIDLDTLHMMRTASQAFHESGVPQTVDLSLDDLQSRGGKQAYLRESLSKRYIQQRSAQLKETQDKLGTGSSSIRMDQRRANLPLRQFGSQVLQMINNNMYCVLEGATGSGKTTQVPQLLLEQEIAQGRGARCNIICTQPRRIAAKSVAHRVADERGERLQNTVGYQVRFDARLPIWGGSITYCTTGILLAQLQKYGSSALDGLSHVILDEAHERDVSTDFLMVVLKKAITVRQHAKQSIPKIVVMSATIDTDEFTNYFKIESADGITLPCPSLSIPGRSFPVQEHYLDDILADLRNAHGPELDALLQLDQPTSNFLAVEQSYSANRTLISQSQPLPNNEATDPTNTSSQDKSGSRNESEDALIPIHLVGAVIADIVRNSCSGAILAFLPGLDELTKVERFLCTQPLFGIDFTQNSRFKIILLHSALQDAQREVFEAVGQDCRKIILATNIAETSITIPEVKFVVDSGKVREKQYSQVRRITGLLTSWESKSNLKQRAGRAGRVANGHYYGLFSRARHESLAPMGVPELLRTDLQSLCLSMKMQVKNASIRDFLADALQPPTSEDVDAAIKGLQNLQALSQDEELTPLGRVLARLPVQPVFGKLIVLGVIFKCLDPMLIVSAASGERPLFLRPLNVRKVALEAQAEYFEGSRSDPIALINAYRELRTIRDAEGYQAAERWARQKWLHWGTFIMIEKCMQQVESVLMEAGLIPLTLPHQREYSELGDPQFNINANDIALIKAILIAGFHPNLAVKTSTAILSTPVEPRAIIHPTSINSAKRNRVRGLIFTYAELTKSTDSNSLMVRDTTLVTPLTALLFGGRLEVMEEPGLVHLDGWLPFNIQGDPSTVSDLMRFKDSLDTVRQIHWLQRT